MTDAVTLAAVTTAVAAGGGVLAHAALGAGSQLFGRTLVAGHDPTEMALTYDDGPNPAMTPALLDLLAEFDARATFFMIGKWVREQPELVRRVQAAGHVIGNHTETHPWLHLKAARVVREELRGCQQALEDVLGAPVRYFRPPHGARRPFVLRYAAELGLTTVQWNAMAEDWKAIGAEAMVANVDRGLRRAVRGGLAGNVLLHDGSDRTAAADRSATLEVTRRLLERCAREGLRTVTVDAWE